MLRDELVACVLAAGAPGIAHLLARGDATAHQSLGHGSLADHGAASSDARVLAAGAPGIAHMLAAGAPGAAR